MTGLGSIPAGLFLYLGERYARNVAGLKKEMHLLWTITIKRPGYKRIVHSIDFSSYKSEYVGKLEIDDVFCEVRYTIYHIEKCIYMDISVNTKTTAQAVKSLEHIQNQVFSAATQKNSIPIISYDAVSEYFCNKTFPLLNSLERNL